MNERQQNFVHFQFTLANKIIESITAEKIIYFIKICFIEARSPRVRRYVLENSMIVFNKFS